MRSFKILLLAGMVVSIPTLADAQWYIGADAGMNFGEAVEYNGTGANSGVLLEEGRAPGGGFTGLAQVGYDFSPSSFGTPKLELEGGYRYAGLGNVASYLNGAPTGNLGGTGSVQVASLMVNGLYEFMPQSSWHPFVGAGIGAAYLDYSVDSLLGGQPDLSADDWSFAYQAIAGVSFDLSRNVAAKLQYRYFATTEDVGVPTLNIEGEVDKYDDHSVLLGLSYSFVKPVMVMAPAPVVAPVKAMSFEVFFDFDSSTITPAALAVIDQAVASAKAGNATSIDLTGHTDTVGSDKYNLALSLKRANAVKAIMVREGIVADIISAVGVGKKGLLVPTPDAVREAQNRRVEILIP